MTMMCDLPHDLLGEKILAKVPITSLKAIRSTCKLWNVLSKDFIVGKTTSRQHEFLGFMTIRSKVCSLRFGLRGIHNQDALVDPSTKQVRLLDQVEITKIFHCDGLVLCVTKENSKLLVWNPYLGQTKWIETRKQLHKSDMYALGCNNNSKVPNYKILRLHCCYDYYNHGRLSGSEIYNSMSESWSVLDLIPDCEIDYYQRGVTLKGDTYFFARGTAPHEVGNDAGIIGLGVFMLCFDYTKERFGPHLTLPFTITDNRHEAVVLSCVREEQLAVLYEKSQSNILDFWVTNKIESNVVSWSKFLKVDLTIKQPRHPLVHRNHGSFFIDEEKKVAVVFDIGLNDSSRHYATTAFIVGEEGYFTSVNIGKEPTRSGSSHPPLVSSSYLPSLLQINQPHQRKETAV
ncbi:hypothetical protein BRARA_H00972 [Brassica rapa]|uniref:F-box associated beta-propeller type 1 domain-containing protein n=2 Tax=Brassica campestris TaxID=3711 RepID=M4DWU5_BRACM|nr:hypothetical protein BRARA_H00972 [Brassica rapa]